MLAGQFRGNNVWTLDGAGSTLDADRVTRLADATLNVSNGSTLSFPAMTEAANVNLTAASDGRILLPVATTYTSGSFGNTLQASGSGSKIDLSALTTFAGRATRTPIKAERGGTLVLAGQFRRQDRLDLGRRGQHAGRRQGHQAGRRHTECEQRRDAELPRHDGSGQREPDGCLGRPDPVSRADQLHQRQLREHASGRRTGEQDRSAAR